jgi:hypothetical protein
MRFDINVAQETYNDFVDWWFDNINESYKESLLHIADKAIGHGFDLLMSIEKARNKLKVLKRPNKKGNFSKFLIDWVSVGCYRYLNKTLGRS